MSGPLPSLLESDQIRLAESWYEVDPSPEHQQIIAAAMASNRDGDDGEAVRRLFAKRLSFGTAGIRGPLGPGPGAMNQVLVRVVAAGLGQFVHIKGGTQVVVGRDARHGSEAFATDTARVLAALGLSVTLIVEPVPTPVLAFAVRHLSAAAGVMVTASHNPRTDNGYKVYGPDGALMAAPDDAELSQIIMATPLVGASALAPEDDPHINRVYEEITSAYVNCITAVLAVGSSRTTRVAYTPLHGVGHHVLNDAFQRAGFPTPSVVASQVEPDGDFPTTPFPNPEEPGAIGELLKTATMTDANLAIANDPDADRIAVAVPTEDSWRLFTGDELGCLVADYLLGRPDLVTDERLVVNTVVSSQLLAKIAARHSAHHEQTLTGFKWIMRAQSQHETKRFILGYEEALGYGLGDIVRDKDGISTALVVAEMAAQCAADDRTLLDALDELWRTHGVHVTGQRALRFEARSGPTMTEVMQRLRVAPPTVLAGEQITAVEDLLDESSSLPVTNAVILHLDDGRLIVRPSGTEPKLKLYGECWRQPPKTDDQLRQDRSDTHHRLSGLLDALGSIISDPERAVIAAHRDATAAASDGDIEMRATRLFTQQPHSMTRHEALRLVVKCIDLTTLAGDDTPGRVRALCAQARRPDPADATVGPTAAVCVYPNLVAVASELTRGSGVAVASVAGAFPSGLSSLEVRLSDIAEAVVAGANEIDVVLNRAAFLAGDTKVVIHELMEMRRQIGSRAMKVIIETSELVTPAAIRDATKLAMHVGADWVKTSTGKTSTGATPMAVLAMAEAIAEHDRQRGEPVGLKISGGVRTSADALGYLAIIEDTLGPAWLHPDRVRFGASGLLTAVVADLASLRR